MKRKKIENSLPLEAQPRWGAQQAGQMKQAEELCAVVAQIADKLHPKTESAQVPELCEAA